MKILFMALYLLACFVRPAAAEVYSWTDERGIEMFTDDAARVPEKHRMKATREERGDGESYGSFNVMDEPIAESSGKRRAKFESRKAPEPEAEKKYLKTPFSSLVENIGQGANSDREKALAIYDFIHKYINYDKEELRNYIGGKVTKSQDALTVVKTQKAVCLGFANLFATLAQEMGLESVVVTGLGAGGYVLGIGYYGPHAWNAVKIDGNWELVDTVFRNFLSPPDKFIYKHLPYDPQWQLLDPPLTKEQWQKGGKSGS